MDQVAPHDSRLVDVLMGDNCGCYCLYDDNC